MKAVLLTFLFGAVAPGAFSEDELSRKNVAERLKEEYRYAPPAKQPVAESSDDVVVMESFTVVESGERRGLERVVSDQERRAKEERYTIIKGGTLLKADIGRARVELGTWSGGGGIGLVRISW